MSLRLKEAVIEDHGWYQQLFNSIDEGFCVVEVMFEDEKAVDYRFVKTNSQFDRQTGLSNVTGKTAREAISDLEEFWVETYGRVVRTGQATRFENHSKTKGRWYDVYVSRVGGPDSLQAVIIFSDITIRKENDRQLAESQSRFRDLADEAPIMIFEATANGDVTFWNKQWLNYTGLTLKEALGGAWSEFVYPADLKPLVQTYLRSYEIRQPYMIEVRVKNHEDDYRWIEFRGNPRRLPDGTFVGFIGTGVDIHDRKVLERQKDDFIGIASHELKTPLTSIKAYTQILERRFKRSGDEQGAVSMGRINAQVDRLNGLVGDLLDITKVETGKLQLRISHFSFDEAIAEAVETVQLTADHHSIAIHGQTDQTIWSDRDRIGQVLINLLGNAIKYSPEARDIEVKLSGDDMHVRACVQDHGVGIPTDKRTQVFERFYRVSGPNMESFPGLGLGLYISSEIVRRLGGRIWVESREGEGSTFCIELPTDRRRVPRSDNPQLTAADDRAYTAAREAAGEIND